MAKKDPRKTMSGVEGKLKELTELQEHFDERQRRAHQRLKKESLERPTGKYLYLGIASIRLESADYYLGGEKDPIAVIKEVQEPPGEVELARALKDKTLFGYISRYARGFSHELIVGGFNDDPQTSLSLAWALTSLMRIRSLGEFICPAYCNVSWSTIAAFSDNSCEVGLLDEYPKARTFTGPPTVTKDDFDWILTNLDNWFIVWEMENFRTAAESYWSYYHYPNKRLMVANLWSGIESLFDIHGELRFRLAAILASILETRGKSRISAYKRVAKLYDIRSRIIHGGQFSDDKLTEHIIEVSGMLARLLARCVESGTVWSRDHLNELLFS